MAASKRQTIEREFCTHVQANLEQDGFLYEDWGEEKVFMRPNNECTWALSCHLSGSGPYFLVSSSWVWYPTLGEILSDLVQDKELKETDFRFGPSGLLIVEERWIAEASQARRLSDAFILAITQHKTEFFEPNSQPSTVAAQCDLFYTKWPRNMGPIHTAFMLIAYGIQSHSTGMIRKGIERIEDKLSFCSSHSEKEIALKVCSGARAKLPHFEASRN